MKKFLLYLTGLLTVLIAALLVNDAVWFSLLTTSTGSSAYKIYRIYGHHPADEIPIFGSSRAQAHFDPDLIGPNCFNYGLDSSVQNETLDLVETYLHHTSTPTSNSNSLLPIIINLDPWGFPSDDASRLVGDYGLVGTSIIGIRSFGKIRSVLTDWVNERLSGTKRIAKGSKLEKISRNDYEWEVMDKKLNARTFYVSEYWRNRVRRLSEITARPIFWVVGPCAARWKDHFGNAEDLDSFCLWINSLPNQRAISLYSLPYDNSLFYDHAHLNIEGARSFSSKVHALIFGGNYEQKN